jgi:hypothetical protein
VAAIPDVLIEVTQVGRILHMEKFNHSLEKLTKAKNTDRYINKTADCGVSRTYAYIFCI